jgi:phosphoglycerate dehydrogenase-like enzyme
LGEELAGKTFGILGFGRIGQAVARRMTGFGLRVVYCDPFVDVEDTDRMSFEELLCESDYISIHVALTPETRGMIDAVAIIKMTKRPIILNMARGPVVDTDALVAALRAGLVRGAALDVTEPEPIPSDHPLCRLKNCIITPHIGTATIECRHNMARLAAQNIVDHFGKRDSP